MSGFVVRGVIQTTAIVRGCNSYFFQYNILTFAKKLYLVPYLSYELELDTDNVEYSITYVMPFFFINPGIGNIYLFVSSMLRY